MLRDIEGTWRFTNEKRILFVLDCSQNYDVQSSGNVLWANFVMAERSVLRHSSALLWTSVRLKYWVPKSNIPWKNSIGTWKGKGAHCTLTVFLSEKSRTFGSTILRWEISKQAGFEITVEKVPVWTITQLYRRWLWLHDIRQRIQCDLCNLRCNLKREISWNYENMPKIENASF